MKYLEWIDEKSEYSVLATIHDRPPDDFVRFCHRFVMHTMSFVKLLAQFAANRIVWKAGIRERDRKYGGTVEAHTLGNSTVFWGKSYDFG